eukprot:359189-Chlamydomonas_euryale.AAC.5
MVPWLNLRVRPWWRPADNVSAHAHARRGLAATGFRIQFQIDSCVAQGRSCSERADFTTATTGATMEKLAQQSTRLAGDWVLLNLHARHALHDEGVT